MLAANSLTTVAAVQALVPGLPEQEAEEAIAVASDLIERAVNRPLAYRLFTVEQPDAYAGTGSEWLIVAHYPLVSVAQVKISGQVVSDWRLILRKAAAGLIFRAAGWPRKTLGQPDGAGGAVPHWSDFNIEIAYSGGYYCPGTPGPGGLVTLPTALGWAAKSAATDLVRAASGSGDIAEERTPGGWSVKWRESAGQFRLSARVLDMLQSYRNPVRA